MFLSFLFGVLLSMVLVLTACDFLLRMFWEDGSLAFRIEGGLIGLGLLLGAGLWLLPASLRVMPFLPMMAIGLVMMSVGLGIAAEYIVRRPRVRWVGGWLHGATTMVLLGLAGLTYIVFTIQSHV